MYDGTFKQDYSTLSSDSAYFYPQDNAFDAFGHVWINQGDTLNIYSDKLNYNGNTKVAILTDNVKMIDKGRYPYHQSPYLQHRNPHRHLYRWRQAGKQG